MLTAPDPAEPAAIAGPEWRPLPPEARMVFTLSGLLEGGIAGAVIGALVAAIAVNELGARAVALVGVGFGLSSALGALRGRIRWKHTRWRLADAGLEVRRGRFWRSETLVPRSRVQHLDLQRGPIERRYGLATLTVHTAGTRTHALSQPGLADADAVALRDALLPEANRNDDAL